VRLVLEIFGRSSARNPLHLDGCHPFHITVSFDIIIHNNKIVAHTSVGYYNLLQLVLVNWRFKTVVTAQFQVG